MRTCDRCGEKAHKTMKHTIGDDGSQNFAAAQDICDNCHVLYINNLKAFVANFFVKTNEQPESKEEPAKDPSADELFAQWYGTHITLHPDQSKRQIAYHAWYDGLRLAISNYNRGYMTDQAAKDNKHGMTFQYWWSNAMLDPSTLSSKEELSSAAWNAAIRHNGKSS